MPISNDDFNKGIENTPLLDFFRQNPDKAYSLTELREQFGKDVWYELQMLVLKKTIDDKIIVNPKTIKEEIYFRLKH